MALRAPTAVPAPEVAARRGRNPSTRRNANAGAPVVAMAAPPRSVGIFSAGA